MKIIDLEDVDRLISFESLEEAEAFCDDPEAFLRKVGALKDDEPFNGLISDSKYLLDIDYSSTKGWWVHLRHCEWVRRDIA